MSDNEMIAKLEALHAKALSRGWTLTSVRKGVRAYRTPTGRKAWLDFNEYTATTQFWFLENS